MVNEVTETFGESRNPPVGFRNTLGKSKRGPKVVTKCHTTHRGATQSKVLPNKAPTKHVGIETRPVMAIRPGVHLAKSILAMQPTNTSKHQQLDATALEFYPEGAVGGPPRRRICPG